MPCCRTGNFYGINYALFPLKAVVIFFCPVLDLKISQKLQRQFTPCKLHITLTYMSDAVPYYYWIPTIHAYLLIVI